MAYECDETEWRAAVGDLTELDCVAIDAEQRRVAGMAGDRDDARY